MQIIEFGILTSKNWATTILYCWQMDTHAERKRCVANIRFGNKDLVIDPINVNLISI